MAPLKELTGRASSAETKIDPAGNSLEGPAESDLAALLDARPHDEITHRNLIQLDRLPASIADRLLRLARSPLLRDNLIIKHSFSSDIDREAIKASRHRPKWW